MPSAVSASNRRGLSTIVALSALLSLLGNAAAQEPATPPPIPFEVETFDGTLVRGSLVRFDGERLVLSTSSEGERTWLRDDLLAVRRVEPPRDDPPRDVIEIANGDRLVARPLAANDDVLRAQWIDFESEPPIEIPLETVRGVAWRLSRDRDVRERTLATLRRSTGDEPGDRLVVENDDAVTGEFRGLAGNGVAIVVSGNETRVPLDRVRTLAFDPELVSLPATPDRTVIVRLVDGSRVTAAKLVIEGERAMIETTFGSRLDLPRSAVATLRFVGGRAVDLSNREPAEFEFTPWLTTEWPWQQDRAVTGTPLRMEGRPFEKGLGVHARSWLAYDLEPGDDSFRATIGLDETAGPTARTDRRGSVVFVVSLDGREAFRSPILRGGEAPVPVPPIGLEGARRLELLVDFSDGGDVLDRANWADAVIVREPTAGD